MSSRKKILVEVLGESSGQIYSRVREDREIISDLGLYSVVIDRADRKLDSKTICNRAKSMAKIIGANYTEDLSWPCSAIKKLLCRCPDCVKEGRY